MEHFQDVRVRNFVEMLKIATCKGTRIPPSGKFLPAESGILGLGIRNIAVGIRNPTDHWNPESKFH